MDPLLLKVRRAAGGEGGFALVTALLSVIVASLLGILVMDLSVHATRSSAYDRSRTQAVHAAEAGLDATMSMFASTSTGSLPCRLTGSLNATPVATWSVAITYYPSYPLVGTAMSCGVNGYLPSATAPGGAELVATGSVSGWPTGTVERQMQMEVSLSAVHGTFNKAIFSNGSPIITSNITVYGENGNDADFITNSNWSCQNSLTVYGSIYVQGTAAMSNTCRTAVDLWANGNVTMSSSARVDHDLKSSTGSVTMSQSSSVGNNVTVGTTCTGCTTGTGGRVGGTVTTGNVQPAPPSTPFPTVAFDSAAWVADGWAVTDYTSCASALAWLTDSAHASQKQVLHITGGCTLSISQNTTITRNADLAIFTDGEITTNNNTNFVSGDNNWHSLYLIVESAASCAGTDGRITMSNQTSFQKLYFFIFSPCYSTFANNNSSARGQIYGQVVAVSNNLTYTFHAMLVPGAGDISGYKAGTKFVREIN
jgi:hypothetical protein